MRHASILTACAVLSLPLAACETVACKLEKAPEASADLNIAKARVWFDESLDQIVFEVHVAGTAGKTKVKARGQLDGAPVLGYVFPTSLSSTDVGFSSTAGIVALALTQHPDFDDSPLWDENLDGVFDNDGDVWHSHWVVLTKDERVPGGLAVKAALPADRLPTTAPKMPMFMDSPGFTVKCRGSTIRAVVPADRIGRRLDFSYDAVAAYMAVSAPAPASASATAGAHAGSGALPMLGVYKVYSVLSGNLSLPYRIER